MLSLSKHGNQPIPLGRIAFSHNVQRGRRVAGSELVLV
jgi:hypothetical protein